MTKEQLIKIAKAAFPDRVKESIDFKNCEIIHRSGVYRLYDKNEPFVFALPKRDYLSIFIGEDKFIQIDPGRKAFNHYAAIKKMEELGLI